MPAVSLQTDVDPTQS